jgi:hypothetical protein
MHHYKLHKKLGVITVPEEYDHTTYLAAFTERQRNRCRVHEYLTDSIFGNAAGTLPPSSRKVSRWKRVGNPTEILHPRERFEVALYGQKVDATSSLDDRLAFLCSQGSSFLGVHGVCLLFEQKRRRLPRARKLLCIDYPERLPLQSGQCLMPVLNTGSDGVGSFSLGDCYSLRSGDKSFLVSFVRL